MTYSRRLSRSILLKNSGGFTHVSPASALRFAVPTNNFFFAEQHRQNI